MARLDDDDLKNIKSLMEVTIDEKVEDGTIASGESINHLPTKDEFFKETSKIYKRQNDLEDGQEALSSRTSENSDRIEKLEDIHPDYKHS